MATVCLLHGNWHDGSCWEPLAASTRAARSPRLDAGSAVGRSGRRLRGARTAGDRGAGVRAAARGRGGSFAGGGHRAHRRGTARARRSSSTCALHPPARSPASMSRWHPSAARFPLPPADEHGASVWDAEVAVHTMYARLPRASARALAERLRPGSSAPDRYPLAGHPDLPGRLILATEDEFFDPEWWRRVASAVLQPSRSRSLPVISRCLSAPAELARLLDGVTHIAGATPDRTLRDRVSRKPRLG